MGLALGFSKSVFDGLYLYAVLGGTYFTDSTTQGIHYEREGYQAVVGAEIELGKRVSLILQSMNYTPLLDRPVLLSRKRNYLVGGLKGGVPRWFHPRSEHCGKLTPLHKLGRHRHCDKPWVQVLKGSATQRPPSSGTLS